MPGQKVLELRPDSAEVLVENTTVAVCDDVTFVSRFLKRDASGRFRNVLTVVLLRGSLLTSTSQGGPYRARTDDIHGVNVALYQLS